MKILYAIQTTGNGHLARAQSIIPRLKEIANIDIITSGPKNDFYWKKNPSIIIMDLHFSTPILVQSIG